MKKIFIILIKIYQLTISPLFPQTCRHYPSCSNYWIEAIHRHGILKGMFKGVGRLLRCHPWGTSGYDPV